jgi:hypothetical protein
MRTPSLGLLDKIKKNKFLKRLLRKLVFYKQVSFFIINFDRLIKKLFIILKHDYTLTMLL